MWYLDIAMFLLFVVVVHFGFPPSSPQYFFRYLSFLKRFSRGDAAFPFNWPHGLIVHGIPAEMSPWVFSWNDLVQLKSQVQGSHYWNRVFSCLWTLAKLNEAAQTYIRMYILSGVEQKSRWLRLGVGRATNFIYWFGSSWVFLSGCNCQVIIIFMARIALEAS